MGKVTIEKLVKVYPPSAKTPEFKAVKGIDLAIEEGEFMVLVGPSGCGKSTTLRMIAGLEEITGGTIAIDGKVINDLLPKDRGIAMVFQNYALYPHMTVFENMAFSLKLAKVSKADIQKRVGDAAKILGLETMLDRLPKALSGGQRQRVAVGRAIVRNPKVFLFDEPLSNLDAKMRVMMRSEISKLHNRLGSTMVYVTHDQVEAMSMGDRICVMKDGEIQQVADPLKLYNSPENMFVAGFIGSPPMNLIKGRVEASGDKFTFVEAAEQGGFRISLSGPLRERAAKVAGTEVIFGIRPESIIESPRSPDDPVLEAQVELAEPMGAETFAYLRTGAHSVIARLPGESHPAQGAPMKCYLWAERAHLFDAKTQKVVR